MRSLAFLAVAVLSAGCSYTSADTTRRAEPATTTSTTMDPALASYYEGGRGLDELEACLQARVC